MTPPFDLTVARLEPRSRALGPGERAVVWFQGCRRACPGCIAAEMNTSAGGRRYGPQRLARRLIAIADIEGVTLSGGDPFDQPLPALTSLLTYLRQAGLSVFCYTGYVLHQLEQKFDAADLRPVLRLIDVLVDGPYVEALNDGCAWRGSSNQVIHFLSPRYASLEPSIHTRKERRIEARMQGADRIAITGMPTPVFMARFRAELDSQGLSIDLAGADQSSGGCRERT